MRSRSSDKPEPPPDDRPVWWLATRPTTGGGVKPAMGRAKAGQIPTDAEWWCCEGDDRWKRMPRR